MYPCPFVYHLVQAQFLTTTNFTCKHKTKAKKTFSLFTMTNSTKSQNVESENVSYNFSSSSSKVKKKYFFFKEFSSDSKSQASSRPKKVTLKKKRGRKSIQTSHKFVTSIVESPAVQIFAVSFNYFLKDRKIFATAAGNKISIYECLETQENELKLLRVYAEPDKDEVFNSISWSFDSRGPILGEF